MSNTERSFLMIKPDGVQRGLVGEIIKRFEAKGFKLVAMKFMWVSSLTLNSPSELNKVELVIATHLVGLEGVAGEALLRLERSSIFPRTRHIHGFRPSRSDGLGRSQRR